MHPFLFNHSRRPLTLFYTLLFALLWVGLSTSDAQAQTVDWLRGESGPNVFVNGTATDGNNNLYAIGSFYTATHLGSFPLVSATGAPNLFVAKFDSQGATIWVKQVGGSEVEVGSIAVDSVGNSYITAQFQGQISFGNFSLSNSNPWLETFIAKYDTNGNFLWASHIRGINNDDHNPTNRPITVDGDGNVYLTGNFAGTVFFDEEMYSAADPYDLYIAKYDTNGNFVWVTQISDNTGQTVNAIAYHDGKVYITGGYYFEAAFGSIPITSAGEQDIFLAAFDGDGTPLWARGAGGPAVDYATDLAVDSGGNIYLTGRFGGTASFGPLSVASTGDNGTEDGFLAKYDNTGTPLWVTNFGTSNSEGGGEVALDSDGNPYVMSQSGKGELFFGTIKLVNNNSNIFVARYDKQGSPVWAVQATSTVAVAYAGFAIASNDTLYLTGGYVTEVIVPPFTLGHNDSDYYLFMARLFPAPTTDLIFKDGFENGDFAAWTNYSSDFGDLSVTPTAALVENLGLSALLDDNITIGMRDELPARERSYRARFYFDPNSLTMAQDENHVILFGYSGDDLRRPVLRLELRKRNSIFQLRSALFDDDITWRLSEWINISNQPHRIELAWFAASAAGENNGKLNLWIDGVITFTIGGVDNDTRHIDTIRLGAIAGIDPGTSGTYLFDAFESRRLTYIGVEPNVSVAMAEPTVVNDPNTITAWTEVDESDPEEAALLQEVLEYADQVEQEEAQEETPPTDEDQSPQLFLPYLNHQ